LITAAVTRQLLRFNARHVYDSGDAAKELGLMESNITAMSSTWAAVLDRSLVSELRAPLPAGLAKQAKAPVKLMLTRQDEFLLAGNRSGSWQKF